MPAADERQLIVKAKEGDHEAFRGLVERYMKHAYNVAYSFVSYHDDAEDIAQESFVRVYQSLQSFPRRRGIHRTARSCYGCPFEFF